jgi:hypothetical protein
MGNRSNPGRSWQNAPVWRGATVIRSRTRQEFTSFQSASADPIFQLFRSAGTPTAYPAALQLLQWLESFNRASLAWALLNALSAFASVDLLD